MRVRVTFGLVALAAVTLALGFFAHAPLLIYVSIGCSVLAFIGLLLSSRRRQVYEHDDEDLSWPASLAEPAVVASPVRRPAAVGREPEAVTPIRPAPRRLAVPADAGEGDSDTAAFPEPVSPQVGRRRSVRAEMVAGNGGEPVAGREEPMAAVQSRPRSRKRNPVVSDWVHGDELGAAEPPSGQPSPAVRPGTVSEREVAVEEARQPWEPTPVIARATPRRGPLPAAAPAATTPAPEPERVAAGAVRRGAPPVRAAAPTTGPGVTPARSATTPMVVAPPPAARAARSAAFAPSAARAATPAPDAAAAVARATRAATPSRPAAAPPPVRPQIPPRRRAPAAPPAVDYPFPIEDYDYLGVAEILPLLPELDDEELVEVLLFEQAGANRVGILNRIDALLEGEE